MDEEAKDMLDGVILRLQKSLLAVDRCRCEAVTDEARHQYNGQVTAYSNVIREINSVLGTHYETGAVTLYSLKEYFKQPKEPCLCEGDEQPSVEVEPIIVEGREEPQRLDVRCRITTK